jgi:hypothetical protein
VGGQFGHAGSSLPVETSNQRFIAAKSMNGRRDTTDDFMVVTTVSVSLRLCAIDGVAIPAHFMSCIYDDSTVLIVIRSIVNHRTPA